MMIILAIAFVAILITILVTMKRSNNDEKQMNYLNYDPSRKTDKQLAEEAERTEVLTEMLRQAKAAGDTKTEKAILANKYDGPLPTRLPDDTWTDMYFDTLTIVIAGINYRTGIKKYKDKVIPARLILEPTNEYDPNAIKIVNIEGAHLGYVPIVQQEEVRNFVNNVFPYDGDSEIYETNDNDFTGNTHLVGIVKLRKKRL